MDLREELRAEYALIQGQYEAFDQRALSLKALSTPLLGTGLAFGIKEGSLAILLATTVVALCLWVLEAIWKGFQYAYQARIVLLERWFRGEPGKTPDPFQIFEAWTSSYRSDYGKPAAVLRIMWAPFVALPYVIIAVGGLAMVGILASSDARNASPESRVASLVAEGRCAEATHVALAANALDLAARAKAVCTPGDKIS